MIIKTKCSIRLAQGQINTKTKQHSLQPRYRTDHGDCQAHTRSLQGLAVQRFNHFYCRKERIR